MLGKIYSYKLDIYSRQNSRTTKEMVSIQKSRQIIKRQHGLIKNKSHHTSLVIFFDRVFNNLEDPKKALITVYLNFNKVFDTLMPLLAGREEKEGMKFYRPENSKIKFLQSSVNVTNGFMLVWKKVSSRVRQGSVLAVDVLGYASRHVV